MESVIVVVFLVGLALTWIREASSERGKFSPLSVVVQFDFKRSGNFPMPSFRHGLPEPR